MIIFISNNLGIYFVKTYKYFALISILNDMSNNLVIISLGILV